MPSLLLFKKTEVKRQAATNSEKSLFWMLLERSFLG